LLLLREDINRLFSLNKARVVIDLSPLNLSLSPSFVRSLPSTTIYFNTFLYLFFSTPLSATKGIERRINRNNFYFNETKGFYCLRTEMGESKCLRETKGRRHPDVDPKVVSQLRKFFAEHNQRFYELVGEDLGNSCITLHNEEILLN
jgi:hypothetical protein